MVLEQFANFRAGSPARLFHQVTSPTGAAWVSPSLAAARSSCGDLGELLDSAGPTQMPLPNGRSGPRGRQMGVLLRESMWQTSFAPARQLNVAQTPVAFRRLRQASEEHAVAEHRLRQV